MGLVSRLWVYQVFLPVPWLPPLHCPARTSPVLPWHHFDLILSLARGSIISHSLVSLGRLGGRQCNKLMEIEEGPFSLLSTLSHATSSCLKTSPWLEIWKESLPGVEVVLPVSTTAWQLMGTFTQPYFLPASDRELATHFSPFPHLTLSKRSSLVSCFVPESKS